ncbi:MAG TPA: HAD family hydrolase [Candidatus Lachnoclostridium stercoravium]|uniref:D,D-heptose 1,7-bisphosphate phosphatase n=1 Tax=Candidatus Lachnoclostridium stercoravium TaxID=2838633 RepID=A0A9D2HII9_9FIRM|nr:HAD family hydrolase [Candidatus Lachnoclostridium stercoravium]
MEKVVFMDRDGTLNEEVHYLHRPEDLVLFDDVPEGLRRLNEAGFKTIVVTNQAGVARGYYQEEDVKKLHQYMNELLEKQGAHIDHFFYCPHHPENGIGKYKRACSCRKPETGMFHMAEAFYEIDKARSYMIGDKLIDTQAGKNYGVTPVLVGTGYGEEFYEKVLKGEEQKNFDFYGKSFREAVEWILRKER